MKRSEELGNNATLQQPTAAKLAVSVGNPAPAKLVFGLSSRTNRSKHDEYAERRLASSTISIRTDPAGVKQTSQQQQLGPTESIIGESGIKVSAAPRSIGEKGKLAREKRQVGAGSENKLAATSEQRKVNDKRHDPQQNVRAPKHERSVNSDRAVNLIASDIPVESHGHQPIRLSGVSESGRDKLLLLANVKQQQQVQESTNRSTTMKTKPDKQEEKSSISMNTSMDKSPTPTGNKRGAAATRDSLSEPAKQIEPAKVNGDQSSVAPKMQFNIPPPPQQRNVTGSITGKSSVVGYAKSRIYDRQPSAAARQQQFLPDGAALLHSGAVPSSIQSGFKPPKQVNVSKARAKWEGGEPFAKCKSRQRLAAQAGKKLHLNGSWSMTSVVATQQLHLQQQSGSPGYSPFGSSPEVAPPVKVLSRGSVLERVQQYERTPNGPSSSGSSSPGSLSSSSSSLSSLDGGANPHESPNGPSPGADEASITLGGGSPKALYRTALTSIQANSNAGKLLSGRTNQLVSSSGDSHHHHHHHQLAEARPGATSVPGRRLSLRRRSSSASSLSSQSIPRFYQPNGIKLNTYEIEVQKKNIVACFDTLPDRKASLAAPNYRRHFHLIALACNFTEYFKEPLYLYVKHQLSTNQASFCSSTSSTPSTNTSTNGTSTGSRPSMSGGGSMQLQRKRSVVVGPSPDKQQQQQQQQQQQFRPLIKAASVDNSTMERLASGSQALQAISCDQFLTIWRQFIQTASGSDLQACFMHLLTFGKRQYLLPDDFVPLIQSIIDDHPGLKFLRAAPDFHMRYIQTVIARIYYCINKSWTGKISLAELRHSNLLAVLQVLAQENDINQVTDYFSYEHFYVIYCKFWQLDQDHDLLISKEDLARHNEASISSRIIERIFTGINSRQIKQTGKMSYADFVWFLIAEEDKKHQRSIEYWFRLMDLDGDGYISMYEMEYFYYEQTKRLEMMNIEALPFLDSACQILDLVNPREKNKISLADLKRTKMATIFFDTFINLEKYLEHESREFVSTRDVIQDGVVVSDWDRYASEEYESLVTEETNV